MSPFSADPISTIIPSTPTALATSNASILLPFPSDQSHAPILKLLPIADEAAISVLKTPVCMSDERRKDFFKSNRLESIVRVFE